MASFYPQPIVAGKQQVHMKGEGKHFVKGASYIHKGVSATATMGDDG